MFLYLGAISFKRCVFISSGNSVRFENDIWKNDYRRFFFQKKKRETNDVFGKVLLDAQEIAAGILHRPSTLSSHLVTRDIHLSNHIFVV